MNTLSPTLIVTVDTEEDGCWSGQFTKHGNSVSNVKGVSRFQALCDKFGIRPTYLVDTPVAEDAGSVRLLKRFSDLDRCEVGAHLHPWCAPPYDEDANQRNSFMCNLPEALQREKVRQLTDLLEKRFDRRPTSFRAGRFGLQGSGTKILSDLGYLVDSSVTPFCSWTREGGPNFEGFPHLPYPFQPDRFDCPNPNGKIVEVPVSVGFNWSNFRRAHAVRQQLSRAPFNHFHILGILETAGILRRNSFWPEGSSRFRLKQIVNISLRNKAPCMVMIFHSSSLAPGLSPFIATSRDLEHFYRTLDQIFDYCLSQKGMLSRTLSDFARVFCLSQGRDIPVCPPTPANNAAPQ
jgi:hypothetical protein